MKAGCIFVDTPRSCSFTLNEKCVAPGSHKLLCLTRHSHTVVDPEAYSELHRLLTEEITSPDRNTGFTPKG